MTKIKDDKYIVFKRDEIKNVLEEDIVEFLGALPLEDAVVIRRRDKFASPVLATYAACIAITASMSTDEVARTRLTRISDYFEQQAQLAAEEGYHLPD